MKLFMVGIGIIAACIVALGSFYLYQTNSASALANAYTCQPNGTFRIFTSGSGAVTGDDQAASARALAWIDDQTKTRSVITTDSTIEPDGTIDPSYTGAIDGTFSLVGASYPVISDASIEVTSPVSVPDDYAGVIEGRVLTTPTMWRWIIQVYKLTDSGYVQVAKQALADADTGAFTIDLSDVVSPPAGSWALGILDAEASYAEYGQKWPSTQYYDGLEVQQKLVTDSIYDWSTTQALADNTFHFDSSNTGKKLFRLVDTASGNILAEYAPLTGLARSYLLDESDPSFGTDFADRSFVYDQAVALFAALSAHDEGLATTLANGLLTLQETTGDHEGAFVFAAQQLVPQYRDALIRTGAHAIATDALLAFVEQYPEAEDNTLYRQRAVAALEFIDTTLSTTGTTEGLYLGGFGDHSGVGGAFVAETVIPWASTEHNLDIWHAFTRAAAVLTDDTALYTNKASNLNAAMQTKLYNVAEARYNQGMTASGPDTANPLDVNSWGAIQLYATGNSAKAEAAIEGLSPFVFTRSSITGYGPFFDSPGYPGAVPNVWFEGSFGVALALLRTGNVDDYRTLIESLKTAQEADGSFDYATDIDATYEITDRKAVASTAWYILATTGQSAIWDRCAYNPPTDPTPDPEPETPITPEEPTEQPSPGTGIPPTPSTNNNPSTPKPAAPATESEGTTDDTAPDVDDTPIIPIPEDVPEADIPTPVDNETTEAGMPIAGIIGASAAAIVAAIGIGVTIHRYRNR